MDSDYPENCLRGILKGDKLVYEDGKVATSVFYFIQNPERDSIWEQSINWQDDNEAINFTLSYVRNDNQLKFPNGVAVIPRKIIDNSKNTLNRALRILSYERQRKDDNKYHGNLLLEKDVKYYTMVQVAATIALMVSEVIKQQNP